tara:strand:- start:182 stop:526 length:345 start_codon:yes stop_codon:yes gene_type:complete
MVAINLEGLDVILVSNLDEKPACFFSISTWTLLAETKAISIPEKKAENNKLNMIITALEVIYLVFLSVLETLLKFVSKKIYKNRKSDKKQRHIGPSSIGIPFTNGIIGKHTRKK